MEIQRGTKLYDMDDELRFVEYEFLRRKGEVYVLQTAGGFIQEISEFGFSRLSLSKIRVLAEIEEKLRGKIEYIHQLMREHKVQFNPLDTADIIYVLNDINSNRDKLSKEIHQYNKDGNFMYTYPSVSSAAKAIGKPDGMSIIRRAVKNNWAAYDYRWSYQKSKKLK